MKKYYILIIFFTLIFFSGCTSKSSSLISFDGFTIKFYDNEVSYISTSTDTSIEGMIVLKEMKEDVVKGDTGFVNSFVIFKTSLYSWADFSKIVEANTKTMQTKLLNYISIENKNKGFDCDKKEYQWVLSVFSYEIEKETLYTAQYFFADDDSMYLLSLASDTKKDVDHFTKSIRKIDCK